jgi:prevent-host-death family protein
MFQAMKQVTIQDLKSDLSRILSQANQGARIEITRHNRPYATLTPPESDVVTVGSRVGEGTLRPALTRSIPWHVLRRVLDEDREDRIEDLFKK